jgi:acyl-CoA thioester hydrolase
MQSYDLKIDLRWADLDPNFHLRHSVYYDYGAHIRFSFLHEQGLTHKILVENHLAPYYSGRNVYSGRS